MRETGFASSSTRASQPEHDPAAVRAAAERSAEPGSLLLPAGGNQFFLSLLGRTAIQPKLRIGPAGDRFEQEADRAAARVARAENHAVTNAPLSPASIPDGVQRKCAKCEEEEEETIRRKCAGESDDEQELTGDGSAGLDRSSSGSPSGPTTETAVAGGQKPEASETVEETPETSPAEPLLLEDSVEEVGPAQMRKTEFLEMLRPAVCGAVDRGLAGTGRNSDGCPHVEFWFDHLADKEASFIERGVQRFAPAARGVASARDYVGAVAERVFTSTVLWAITGSLEGVPEEFATIASSTTGAPAPADGAAAADVQFMARAGGANRPDSPSSVRAELGGGRPLDGAVRSRMEAAYGTGFGHVRIHTDQTGARMSEQFNARAFTVGEHVAFGAGEYRPGTPIGDVLIAHELAHVVQQGGAKPSVDGMEVGCANENALESDADAGAIRAAASLWGGSIAALSTITGTAIPRLRSGLQLSRCSSKQPCTTRTTAPTPRKTVTVRHSHLWGGGSAGDFTRHLTYADRVYDIAGIDIVAGNAETVNEADTKSTIGADAKVATSGDPPNAGSYTAEETALFGRNTAGGEVTAYYIQEMLNVDLWGLAYTDSDKLLLEPQVSDRVLAHELGHLLIGRGHPSNNDNIMAKSSVASGVDCLSDDQITDARNDSLAK
jgi:hypothetical protein